MNPMRRVVPSGRAVWLIVAALSVWLALPVSVRAADFDIPWWTIDGGGEMWTTGGNFELSGTIGQPDASVTAMTGGDFELVGGFWPVAAGPPWVRGDLNCDGAINAFDIDPFVLALTNPAGYQAAYPNCNILNADIDCDGVINAFDIDPFVKCLTVGCPPCP